MAENTTLVNNEVVEDVMEAAVPAATEAVGKAIAEYKITTADKVMAGGIIGLAVVGLGSIGYFGYKGGKKLYNVIKSKVAEAKAAVEADIPEAVEVIEEEAPKKATKKKAVEA